MFDASGLLRTVVVSFGLTFRLVFRVLLLNRCRMAVMDSSRWLLQVPHSSGCFCMIGSGYIWLLMLLKGFKCFLPVLDGNGRFWPDLWTNIFEIYYELEAA